MRRRKSSTLRTPAIRAFVLLLTISLVTAGLTSCTTAPVDSTLFFVTSTVPPTNSPSPKLTTPTPAITPAAILMTSPPNCKDAAILLQDVTIADGTNIPRATKFTKTWKFQNVGTCSWTGYAISFVAGDRMSAPDSSLIPQTAPNASVNISVDLSAPASDGMYTGYFELRDSAGKPVPIGSENTFWVKIIVGQPDVAQATSPAVNPPGGTNPVNVANCNYSLNAGYVSQVIALINSARAQANIPALAVNSTLASAAQCHSLDMACHNFLAHTGSDGSPIGECIRASGYPSGNFSEIIAIGDPQYAMGSWMNEPGHRAVVLNSGLTEFGVGYAYVASSNFGGYYTVDFGSP
jgi:uncharacterized protein YkwD